jgi:hypothetical protein
MKSKSIFRAGFAILFMALGATAGTMQLIPVNYNFPLAGGGGGASATLDGVPVEIFCDDFANDIYVPSNNTADVTTLGTSVDLSNTRFGGVLSNGWTTIALNDGNATLDNQDNSFFNTGSGSSGLARYEMVAYLVSLYNQSLGGNASNNQIQEAIWTIMDPSAEGAVINPSGVNDASYLEQAVTWYTSMNTPGNQNALNSFLSGFEVVSSANMNFSNGLGVEGFQEQIVMGPVVTPEPRGAVWMLLALLVGGFLVVRRNRATGRSKVDASMQTLVANVSY